MNTLTIESPLLIQDVRVSKDALSVDLTDGRTISTPLAWYPRLLDGSAKERNQWELLGDGIGIHWPALDEDLSLEGMMDGRPSGESQRSLEKWLNSRANKS